MASDTETFTPQASKFISDELAANYDAIVADENRNTTYGDIAEQAAAQGDKATAAWARQREDDLTKPAEPVEPEPKADYEAMKVDDLKALATERKIDTSELKLKADLVDAHVAWDAAQPAVDINAAAATAQAAAS